MVREVKTSVNQDNRMDINIALLREVHDTAEGVMVTPNSTMEREILEGLLQTPKRIASKYFYDARGSELFEAICELPEYYPTRTESAILAKYAHEMAERIGPNAIVIEFGSGSSTKTRILLDALISPKAYIPVDISEALLLSASAQLRTDYPNLIVEPVHADYTSTFRLPEIAQNAGRVIAFFPGSTIGNFEPQEAAKFLERIAHLVGEQGALLIGVDLRKSIAILEPAYNDSQGITAQFNLNVITRLHRELGIDLSETDFGHYAFFNSAESRIEMHLIAKRDFCATIAGQHIEFRNDEHVITEYSYKYSLEAFNALALDAGFAQAEVWKDEENLFSVQLLDVAQLTNSRLN
jgi:dimethylhistidine N-methyltransferase